MNFRTFKSDRQKKTGAEGSTPGRTSADAVSAQTAEKVHERPSVRQAWVSRNQRQPCH